MKDPRERHVVCKLDRYELEDRYLRLLEEVSSLKKLSHVQEDKIKRLATKLMRFGANPRAYIAAIDVTNDRDKLSVLEAENSKLRDKVCILRNQLVNNKIYGRSPSRGRKPTLGSGPTSGPTTCRSESSRLKALPCQCINTRPATDENDVQNYSLKIQKLEDEKKEMISRISELESELANVTSGNRREKVAENIEYIRVWREMKRQNEKLVNSQAANEILNQQICQLKSHLEDSYRNNKEVNTALEVERQQVVQLDASISRIRDSQIDAKEKDQRIIDLTKEIGILQQHNSELLGLSSSFGKVEQENIDLKRRISEQHSDYLSLKDTLTKEKANTTAVCAANDQLLSKLHELQKSMDVMTIQLMAQTEKSNKTSFKKADKKGNSSTSEEKSTLNKNISDESVEACKNCCAFLKIKKFSKNEKAIQTIDKKLVMVNEATQTEMLVSAKSNENNSNQNCDKNKIHIQHPPNGNSLSREGMLKLLEQVQISTPLESQNATRLRHTETSSVSNRVPRQVTNLETFLFGNSL